jgi:hypothetical protein
MQLRFAWDETREGLFPQSALFFLRSSKMVTRQVAEAVSGKRGCRPHHWEKGGDFANARNVATRISTTRILNR